MFLRPHQGLRVSNRKIVRGSAGTWVLGCLVVIVILIAVAIVVGMYLWNTMARPSMAVASPDDLRYFLDDMPSERRMGNIPRMLIVSMGGEEDSPALVLQAMPPDCVVSLYGVEDHSEMRQVMLEFSARNNTSYQPDDPDTVDITMITVSLDAAFQPTLQTLAESLAEYSNAEEWTYAWFGNSFVVPDHIEVSSGAGVFDSGFPMVSFERMISTGPPIDATTESDAPEATEPDSP